MKSDTTLVQLNCDQKIENKRNLAEVSQVFKNNQKLHRKKQFLKLKTFSFISVFIKQTIPFLRQINVKNVIPFSIRCRYSNPRPFKHESSSITTRPGLPPKNSRLLVTYKQCDQIWRFIGLWATFQSLWQQLIWPNISHS